MLFTCYVTGFACIRVISGKEGYSAWRETDYLGRPLGESGFAGFMYCVYSGLQDRAGRQFPRSPLDTFTAKSSRHCFSFPAVCLWCVYGPYSL